MDFSRRKLRLGDLLVNNKVISSEQLNEGLKLQKERHQKLGEVLVDIGFCTEESIASALAKQLKLDMVDLAGVTIDDEIKSLVPVNICKKYTAIAYAYNETNPNILRVAMADPMDMDAIDDFSIITNRQIETVVSTPRSVILAIDKTYGASEVLSVADKYAKEKEQQALLDMADSEEVNEDVESSPIVQLVKSMIEQAVRQRASDIHIEPLESRVRVRYRIDGALFEKMTYSTRLLQAIVARIKIIGGMDISEKRKPQDGRITQIVDKMEFDIRVSILPTVYGEKVVMRLTSKSALTREKSQLGLNEQETKMFDHIFSNPHGIILVTGPTGSGKSTTLYTALSELNKEEVNIITVEDPVEANINGINQVHVNAKADLTFASALRSILRQDPDIVMIGEIRDGETANIAVQASITGHLVVSTLHTNSSSASPARLIDMGCEPYLLADSIVGIIAQRLVRRLCPKCKIKCKPDEEEREILKLKPEDDIEIFKASRGSGCVACDGAGYKGRIGVYEIMDVSPPVRRLIAKSATAEEIKDEAMKHGLSTLRMSATRYVLDGITSVEEMKKVSFDE